MSLHPVAVGAWSGALAAIFVAVCGHGLGWLSLYPGDVWVGTPQGTDLWTYFSMARAVWDSPNGITYSYPYDLYWPVPPVLFQLPITLLAWVGRVVGLPLAFELGRVAGAAGAGAAVGALAMMFRRGFWRWWFLVALLPGGGLFWVGAMVLAWKTAGPEGFVELWQYQWQSEDRLLWWLPFLVRNLRLPLECIYHALVMGALACLVWRRHGWALVLGLCVWLSNPFSAVALHSAVVPWLAWRVWETRGEARRRMAVWLGGWLLVNALAAVYYGWFLNRWPLLMELHELYRIQHVPPLTVWQMAMLLLPYGAGLLATAVWPWARRAVWGSARWRLFALLALAHIVLIQQSAFLGERAMQSYHYNRGYLQLGLVMTAWRVLTVARRSAGLGGAGGRWFWPWRYNGDLRRRATAWVVAVVVSLTCLDQVLFACYALTKAGDAGYVSQNFRTLLRRVPAEPAPMIIYSEPFATAPSYITAFTPHIAWNAEDTMVVPFWYERGILVRQALQGQHGGVAALGIDYMILPTGYTEEIAALIGQGWQKIDEAGYLSLLRSPSPRVGKNPSPPKSVHDLVPLK